MGILRTIMVLNAKLVIVAIETPLDRVLVSNTSLGMIQLSYQGVSNYNLSNVAALQEGNPWNDLPDRKYTKTRNSTAKSPQ